YVRVDNGTACETSYEMEWTGEYWTTQIDLYYCDWNEYPMNYFEFYDYYWMHSIYHGYIDFFSEPNGPDFYPGNMVGNPDYNLLADSPAIDAGHPDYFDPDGSIKDIGSRYYDQGTAAPAINSITADILSGDAPLVVQFTADISGPVVERLWSFGDGGASTGANPVHMYTVAGTYTVTLTVSGPGGADSYTAVDYITVGEQQIPPIANFTATPVLGVVPLTVNFTNLSSGDITGYNWSFG
ncbi:uncharacterized protein METZ01_LOCUS487934, partial [marine metagenome]